MIGQLLTERYLILKRLGSGGFSETFLARDKYLPHNPLCVVKYLKPSPNSTISLETAQQLFEAEARVLDHLGRNCSQIPTLLAYCQEQNQAYQIQDYIEGDNLGDWIIQEQWITPEQALELLLQVLPTLVYIHSHNVIHHDVKPSNLIRRQSDHSIVLIDFGAARLESEAFSRADTDDHEAAFVIGTPGYMPDEQKMGKSRFDSDLYALGMSVIHLMTGVHPRQLESDPISGELDWQAYLIDDDLDPKFAAILNSMVRRHARDRYQKATDVLTALKELETPKQFQKPILEWSWRDWMSHRLKPIAASLLALGAIAGGVYLSSHRSQTAALVGQLGMLVHPSNLDLTLLQELPLEQGIDQMLIAPDNRALVTAGSDHTLRLWTLDDGAVFRSMTGHTGTVNALAISQDGRWLVSGASDRTVRLWDTASGSLLQTFDGNPDDITAVAISSDARTLVGSSKNGTLHLWDRQTGSLLQTLQIPSTEITAIAFGATPDRLYSASSDRQIQVWDLRNGKLERTFSGHTASIEGLQVVDDHLLFSFGEDRTLVWDIEQEQLVRAFPEDAAKPLTSLLSNHQLMTVLDNGSIRIWTRKATRSAAAVSETLGHNLNVVLSADHQYLVSLSPDQHLRFWQMKASPLH